MSHHPSAPASSGWLNRTVIGAGLTSFLADVGYEMATAIFPAFVRLLNLPPEAVGLVIGLIEGVADLLSNIVKLIVGWYSDTIGKRKAFVVGGYALTGASFALCAFAITWPLVMVAKVLAWIGKGLRQPLRNAIVADAVEPEHRGKAFGFHRAGDTAGAIVGPLIGAALIAWMPAHWFDTPDQPYRVVFLVTLIPGLGAALTFALMIREKRFTPKPGLRFGASVRMLPQRFRKYLVAVFVFGCGDFSHTLLILAATMLLSPVHEPQKAAAIAAMLYAVKNAAGAIAAFPAGFLGDRFGRRPVLVTGYLLGVATMAGFLLLFATGTPSVPLLAVLFAGGGIYVAVQEAIEPAMTADLVPDPSVRGTAYGVLATVNGLGDFFASVGVGALFMLGAEAGFGASAAVMLIGSVWMMRAGRERRNDGIQE
jgi:MFS family permease